MTIKSLPIEERPIEKAVSHGIKALSNTELLALILHTGSRGKSALHLAEEVLSKDTKGLTYLGEADLDELLELTGIGTAKACTILAAVELGKRISQSPRDSKVSINSTQAVANLFMEDMRYLKKEYFKTCMVNTKGEVIYIDNVSVGELSSTLVHPREVYTAAIKKSAAGVIFVHNHPSGDPTPSQEDIVTTERLRDSGDLLGIRVLDHIIIGDGEYSSLKAMGIID